MSFKHRVDTLKETTTGDWQTKLVEQLAKQPPFSSLENSELIKWLQSGQRLRYKPGDRLIRPDEINAEILVILKGSVRLIADGGEKEGQITLDKRGPGQLIGWASLLRGAPTEFVHASTEVVALSLPATSFIDFTREVPAFAEHFYKLSNLQEAYTVAVAATELQPKRIANWRDGLLERVKQSRTKSLTIDGSLKELEKLEAGWIWHLCTPGVHGVPVGTPLEP